jgi:ABC-type dipeptide/oligopeptide/nickel transport system ATPase subunit
MALSNIGRMSRNLEVIKQITDRIVELKKQKMLEIQKLQQALNDI